MRLLILFTVAAACFAQTIPTPNPGDPLHLPAQNSAAGWTSSGGVTSTSNTVSVGSTVLLTAGGDMCGKINAAVQAFAAQGGEIVVPNNGPHACTAAILVDRPVDLHCASSGNQQRLGCQLVWSTDVPGIVTTINANNSRIHDLYLFGGGIAPAFMDSALVAGGALTSGTPVYYRVTAVIGGVETAGSLEVTKTPSGGNLSVSISWTGIAGASAYNVYRTTTSGQYGASSYAGTTATTPYVDTGGALSAGTIPRSTSYGVNVKGLTITLERLVIENFAGAAVNSDCSVGSSTNCNDWHYTLVRAINNFGDGFYFAGTDSNQGLCLLCDATQNRGKGFWNKAATNTFINAHNLSNSDVAVRDEGSSTVWDQIYCEAAAIFQTPGTGLRVFASTFAPCTFSNTEPGNKIEYLSSTYIGQNGLNIHAQPGAASNTTFRLASGDYNVGAWFSLKDITNNAIGFHWFSALNRFGFEANESVGFGGDEPAWGDDEILVHDIGTQKITKVRLLKGDNQSTNPVLITDGAIATASGTNILYKCSVAGTLRVGQTTTVSADCGTAVDTGLRVP